MTPEQIQAEISWYHHICQTEHPDNFCTVNNLEAYTPDQRRQATAEIAYIFDKNKLPPWGYIIESFELIDGNILFIHADLTRIT